MFVLFLSDVLFLSWFVSVGFGFCSAAPDGSDPFWNLHWYVTLVHAVPSLIHLFVEEMQLKSNMNTFAHSLWSSN